MRWILATLACGLLQDEGVRLRYAFQPGQAVSLRIRYTYHLQIEDFPPSLKEHVSNEPIDLEFDGRWDGTAGPEEKGVFRLQGAWRTVEVHGRVMTHDLDYAYDVSKDPHASPPSAESPDRPPPPAHEALLKGFKALAENPSTLTVSPQGAISLTAPAGSVPKDLPFQVFLLHGFMGPLPEREVRPGDKWSGQEVLAVQTLGTPLLTCRSDNTYGVEEKVGDDSCAVISFVLRVEPGAADPSAPYRLKATGGGEGRTRFCAARGRPVASEGMLDVHLLVNLLKADGEEDPGMNFKVNFKFRHSCAW